MNLRLNKKAIAVLLLILAALTLSGCSGEGLDKLWLKSSGWSRGVSMGETAMASPMEPVIDPDGNLYGITFPRTEPGSSLYHPHLSVLSANGQTRSRIGLDFEINQPRKAKLIWNDLGLDLIWIESNQLKAVRLTPQGERLSEIAVLSTEERVDHLEALLIDGSYQIWYSGSKESPGVYALSGKLDSLQKTVIDPEGIRINLFLDAEDQLHISWFRYPIIQGDAEFYYQQLINYKFDDNRSVLLNTTGVSPAIRIEGPVLGIDDEVGYIIWVEEIVSGLEAGTRNTFYRYFPVGEPDFIRPQMRLRVPIIANLPADEFNYGAFQTGDRIYVYSGIPSSSDLDNIELLNGQYSELAFVFRSRSEFKWRDFRNQANIAFLSDGLVTSYQPLSYTSAESYYPSVVTDQDLNLYVTWLEKGESTYRAYLTTTDPLKKDNIDLVTTEDYLYLTAEGIFGMLAGAVLSPFAVAAWGGIGLIGFIFNLVFSQFNKPAIRTFGEILSMIAGIGVFWFMKMVTLPGLKDFSYVPFSAWIPRIPADYHQLMIYGVPALIGLIALLIAYFNTYGKKNQSSINFYMLYCAVDTLFSCAIYGVLIYGAF